MRKVMVVDSGRQWVKGMCGAERLKFQAIVAPGKEFNMDVALSDPNYYWIRYEDKEYFCGELAIRQSDYGFQDRGRDKNNHTNRILIANATSMFADQGDEIILLTNVPARDWSKQKRDLAEAFKGRYIITHRAGIRQGMMIDYKIIEVYPLPEGAGAYYGFVYNEQLQTVHPEYEEGASLILEVGDETVNYIVMEDGEYVDDDCGSLDLGIRVANSALQKWLEVEGRELTHAEIANHIINGKQVFIGNIGIDLSVHAKKEYSKLGEKIYNQLSAKFKFSRFRNVLLGGGGGLVLQDEFAKRLNGICRVDCPKDGQWLNAKGFMIMYQMMKRAG